jgi:hypothetical protein
MAISDLVGAARFRSAKMSCGVRAEREIRRCGSPIRGSLRPPEQLGHYWPMLDFFDRIAHIPDSVAYALATNASRSSAWRDRARRTGRDRGRRLAVTPEHFERILPNLIARGFPAADPDTGNFDLEAIDAWRRALHPHHSEWSAAGIDRMARHAAP